MNATTLLSIANTIAKDSYDGHLTILRFTTNWKSAFGTVVERDEINSLEPYRSLNKALHTMIVEELTL